MTKITGIPRMIGMTGHWDEKRTRVTEMSRMTGLTGITTIMDKSPWDSNAIFIFLLSFLGSLIKRCILFEIFLLFSFLPTPHPLHPITLYKVETLKTTLFVGGGRGWACVNWKMLQECKSV